MSILYPHFLLDGTRLAAGAVHAGAEPDLDLPGRLLVAARAARRGARRPARRADADVVGDRVVGGLRAADGPRTRAPRHALLRDARRPLARLSPARPAGGDGARWASDVEFTYEANPGEVWEEGEFWIEVSWRADPDGSLGIRQYYESPYRPGREDPPRGVLPLDVRALGARPAGEGGRRGARPARATCAATARRDLARRLRSTSGRSRTSATPRSAGSSRRSRAVASTAAPPADRPAGHDRRGASTASRVAASTRPRASSSSTPSPSWPTGAGRRWRRRTYARSHVHHSLIDHERGEYVLLPTYRLPTLIHSRSGNAKYLNELSHTHPLLVCPEDAERIGLQTGDLHARGDGDRLVRHQGPGHRGHPPRRRRRVAPHGPLAVARGQGQRTLVLGARRHDENGERPSRFRQIHGVRAVGVARTRAPSRVWWSDAGVHQNITFPVHPDPISGMHCWHQKVRVRAADPDDRYADIHVDFAKARAVYRKWLALARPAAGDAATPDLALPARQAGARRLPPALRTNAPRRHAAHARSSLRPARSTSPTWSTGVPSASGDGWLTAAGNPPPSRRLGRLNARPADAGRCRPARGHEHAPSDPVRPGHRPDRRRGRRGRRDPRAARARLRPW